MPVLAFRRGGIPEIAVHGETAYLLDTFTPEALAGAMREVTHFTDYDVHFPSIGPDAMVFENGGKLYLMDLATEKIHEIISQYMNK